MTGRRLAPANPTGRVSLCLVVRDEEAMLPRFLEHAKGLWDELVAVDTGSKDRTRELLAAAGARVLDFPWVDDFAAARNHGLAAATGDFILVLDADELATPALAKSIRAAAADPRVGAGTLELRNLLPHGHVRTATLLRFFRNDPSIRFEHAIHEDASAAVFAHLAATGQRLVRLDGWVDHLGYQRERALEKGKKRRDVVLLEKLLARDPRDLYSHLKRLEQARFWGDRDLWRRAAQDAKAALDAAPARAQTWFGGELLVLVAEGLHPLARQPKEALALLEAWATRVPPSAAFSLRRGELREALGDFGGAEADFLAARAQEPRTQDRQLATVRPLLGLARLGLALGDADAALARTNEALALAPRDPEALLSAVALHRARGGRKAVLAFAAAHRKAHPSPEVATAVQAAVGDGALLSGDLALAIDALADAAGDPPAGRNGLRLAQAVLAAGDLPTARALCTQLAPALPEAALGLLVCDLVDGQDSALEIDLDPEAANAALRTWIEAVKAGRNVELVRALQQVAPAVADVFPWLEAALRT